MYIAMFSRFILAHQLEEMEEITWDLAVKFSNKGNQATFVTTKILNYDLEFDRDEVRVCALL